VHLLIECACFMAWDVTATDAAYLRDEFGRDLYLHEFS